MVGCIRRVVGLGKALGASIIMAPYRVEPTSVDPLATRALQMRTRLLVTTLGVQDACEREVRAGIDGVARNGFPSLRFRLLQIAEFG